MKAKLLSLSRSGYTLAEMEGKYRYGLISLAIWRAWLYVWSWSAPRFGGIIGARHEAYYEQHGKAAYYAKINKCRAAFGFSLLSA